MSLFGRIKSAVVGNPVTKEYELGRHIASAGPGLMWKVYSATKKTTRQVCIYYITCMYMYHNLLSIELLLYNVCTCMYSTCTFPDYLTCMHMYILYTVVSRVSTHGRLNIHVHVARDFGPHGRLPRIYMIVTSMHLYISCYMYIDPLKRAKCTWVLLPGTLWYMYV